MTCSTLWTPEGELRIHNPPWEGETWWSAEDKRYANYDPWAEFEQPPGSHLVIHLWPHRVIKHTPKGVWLTDEPFGLQRFLCHNWYKQWASPTQKEALQHLIARKQKHVRMSEARLARAQEHLRATEHFHEEMANANNNPG